MSEASNHDRHLLLVDDCAENASAAAYYLSMVEHYRRLNNLAGMRYNLKCGEACLNAAMASERQIEALSATPEYREAAE